jgi:hypothetical protein
VRFDVVSRVEWLDRLAKSDPDGTQSNDQAPGEWLTRCPFGAYTHVRSAYNQGFYRNRFGNITQLPRTVFRVDLTSKVAPSIANSSAISQDLVGRWIKHWRSTGFMVFIPAGI